jgi:hypothetical protein
MLAFAVPDERGSAESTTGKRAKVNMQDAQRAKPTLALDSARHPPKVRR